MQVFDRPPWTFRALRFLLSRNVPGAWRFYETFAKAQLAGQAARFPLLDGSAVALPLTWPGLLAGRGIDGYEPQAIDAMVDAIACAETLVVLIDAGADVGLVARLIASKSENVSRIISYEPNPKAYELLALNLGDLTIPAEAREAAVADTPGQGTFLFRPDLAHDHSAHLADGTDSSAAGLTVSIETIDQAEIAEGQTIALKIDVEGVEAAVLKGAQKTLTGAAAFVVQFEAHPDVARRSGQDPSHCLEILADFGATAWTGYCEKTGEVVTELTPDRPFFEQVDPAQIYDVIATRNLNAKTSATKR